MPLTFIILIAAIIAVVGGVMLVATRYKRAGAFMLIAGLAATVGLSLLLVVSLQTM